MITSTSKQVIFVFVVFAYLVTTMQSKYIGAYYWSGATKAIKADDINPHLLTHLYYAFLLLNEDGTFTIQQLDKGYVEDLSRLKTQNPELKLLFSVSNQNSSFSTVVANENLRVEFVKNALNLIKKYNYDGIDFDWEFPGDQDKENFAALLKETYSEFKRNDYLVTAAVRAIPVYKNTGYDVPEMVKYLDIINIMTYDYFGSWSNTTGLNAPLYPSTSDNKYERNYLNIEASIKNWVKAGASKDSLAMGLPFYGRTFDLTDPHEHGIHAPSKGGGRPAALTYYQILANCQSYTTVWDEEQMGPYKYSGTTWLAYDDERSIENKVQYAVKNGLRGVFVWQLGGDDIFGEFTNKKQSLLQTINDNMA